MQCKTATALLLVLMFLSASVSAVDTTGAVAVERAHFVFYFDNPAHIDRSDSVLAATRSRLIGLLRDSLRYKPAVHLLEDLSRFKTIIGGYFPDWGAAAAVPPRRLIAIKSPDRFNIRRSLTELLAHEYAHLALAERCGMYRPPRWLDEGVAMLASSEWSWSDNLAMSRAAVFGQLIPLRDIELVNRFGESKAHVAYAESYLAVHYLFDEYGIDAVNILLDDIAAGRTLDQSLLSATGSDYAGFEAEFKATLMQRFNVVSLFMDTIYLWVGLALIVVIGGILRYRKRREYYKRWEEQEKYQSTDFDYGDPDRPEQTDDDEPWRQ